MAEMKLGRIVGWQKLSSILAIFRLSAEDGSRFPDYVAGQYIALRRENCQLTRKVVENGQTRYVPDLDASGKPKLGPITHSYSVASAPFESQKDGHLEFYVVLELDADGTPGRWTRSLFETDPPANDRLLYVNRITGNFTLEHTADGRTSVLLVGTGTGLAPFISMIKQLDFEARQGSTHGVTYTLLHTNRTYEELAYHTELLEIQAAQRFDFRYIASVSRPTERDLNDPQIGGGRANNVLRYVFDMPLKEEEELEAVLARGGDPSRAKATLAKTVKPSLPTHVSRSELRKRFEPSQTVILTCGNPWGMADIGYVAEKQGIRFEKEDW
jgi:ferredoxin-NADP reductase